VVDFEGFREYEPIIGHLHDVMTVTNGMLLNMESHDALCRKVLAYTDGSLDSHCQRTN
jgi:hypothetical protein